MRSRGGGEEERERGVGSYSSMGGSRGYFFCDGCVPKRARPSVYIQTLREENRYMEHETQRVRGRFAHGTTTPAASSNASKNSELAVVPQLPRAVGLMHHLVSTLSRHRSVW